MHVAIVKVNGEFKVKETGTYHEAEEWANEVKKKAKEDYPHGQFPTTIFEVKSKYLS